MRRNVLTVVVLGLSIGASACSADVEFSIGGQPPEDAAVDLIEGELSDDLGLAMTGECDDVDDPEVGVSFECTGTTDDGRIIEFDATIDEEDHISVFSVNVVNAGAVGRFAAAAAEAVSEQTGVALDASAVDCGDEAVVLDDTMAMACSLTDPGNGDVYDATITITDLDEGLFDVDVGDLRS